VYQASDRAGLIQGFSNIFPYDIKPTATISCLAIDLIALNFLSFL
jgi:hypothetical protein